MWFKKKEEKKDKSIEELITLVNVFTARVISLDKEVDMIKLRLKNRAFSKPTQEEVKEEETEKLKYSDPFDFIRKMGIK